MNANDLQEFSYRRGLVLGFTAAEITVLLLFLMLLIMGLVLDENSESDELPPEEQIAETELEVEKPVPYDLLIIQFEEKSKELQIDRIQIVKQQAQIEKFESELNTRQEHVDILTAERDTATKRNERYQLLIDQQQSETHALREQTRELNREFKEMRSRNEQLQDQVTEQTANSAAMEEQLVHTDEESQHLASLVRNLERKLEDVDAKNQYSASSVQELRSQIADSQTIIDRLRTELRAREEKMNAQSKELTETGARGKFSEYLVEELEKELAEEQRSNDTLQRAINELTTKSNIQKESIRRLSEEESNEFTETNKKLHQLEAINRQLETELAQAKNASSSPQAQVASSGASDSKGTNSACWYRMKRNDDGTETEHALYLFDVQIADDHILVFYPSKSRNGSASNPNFSRDKLAEIFDEMAFDRNVLGKPLNFDQFRQVFGEFRAAGRGKKIRHDRRCTFHVALWDHTSLKNKEGYQRAKEQVVDQVFYSFRYQDDPWPYDLERQSG